MEKYKAGLLPRRGKAETVAMESARANKKEGGGVCVVQSRAEGRREQGRRVVQRRPNQFRNESNDRIQFVQRRGEERREIIINPTTKRGRRLHPKLSGQPNTASVRFRPKYVSVSAFRLSPVSAIWPKHAERGCFGQNDCFGQKRMFGNPLIFNLCSSS